jgi:hypothetical protein
MGQFHYNVWDKKTFCALSDARPRRHPRKLVSDIDTVSRFHLTEAVCLLRVSARGDLAMLVANADGTEGENSRAGPALFWAPVWSPDGKVVLSEII